MPSKALLRPPEARAEARAPGLGEPAQEFAPIAKHRDRVISNLDDSKNASAYAKRDIEVVRGEARVTGLPRRGGRPRARRRASRRGDGYAHGGPAD
jgi:pyruvate/2-oxoglutarate dehydrogenase complex dihydrolipoamide dehydrogenase (E3) component